MFCLQGNSKMVMLMGILFPNLIDRTRMGEDEGERRMEKFQAEETAPWN